MGKYDSEFFTSVNDDGKLYRRWTNKRVNAKKENIKCLLFYEDYCKLVHEAGLVSSQLGFNGEGYVLARYNDTGCYEYGNCRFIKQKENSDEKMQHQPHRVYVVEDDKLFISTVEAANAYGILLETLQEALM